MISTITKQTISNKKKEENGEEMVYEEDHFNAFQNFLYRRALFGLSIYSKHELKEMHKGSMKRIDLLHKRTQLTLNLWKQDLINSATTEFFTKLFPDCEFVEVLRQPSKPDPYYKNGLSFRDLGITKEMIVAKLIKKKLLPKQFYDITQESLRALNFGKQFNY